MNRRFFPTMTLFALLLFGTGSLRVSADKSADERTMTFQETSNPGLTLPSGNCKVLFSPDGRYVATFSDIVGQIWECSTGRLVYRTSSSHYKSDLQRRVDPGLSLRFVNESTIIDSGQMLVDLDKNLGEPVRDWNVGNDRFFPLDADHGFILTSRYLSLINHSEKVTVWSFDTWSIKKRNGAPGINNSQLGIDHEAGRIVFVWNDNENTIISSVNFEGNDCREEARGATLIEKGYGGYKFKIRSNAIVSPDGKSALLYNAAVSIKNVRLITLGSAKSIKLEAITRDEASYKNGFILSELSFTREGDVEFFQQQEGKMVSLVLDRLNGKVKERVLVSDGKGIGSRTVTHSPDRKTAAFIRFIKNEKGYFFSVGLYDAKSGALLHLLDDSAQTIALSQSEEALYQRNKAARAAAEAAIYAQREARRVLREKESDEAKKREEEERQAFIARTRPCARCDGKGSYEVIGSIISYVEDGYYESRVSPFSGDLVYRNPIYKRVSRRGKVSYGCPSCGGKGRIPK